MDKFIFIALGVGALIIAAVDQAGDSMQEVQSPAASEIQNSSGVGGLVRPTAEVQPSSAAPPQFPEPVNPIPQASDLGGKVLESRFQPDG